MANKRERQQIDGKWYTKPKRGAKKELTRCSNTMTESEFIGVFISALRDMSMRWLPRSEAWKKVRRTCKKGRQQYEGQCIECKEWCAKKDIEMDHIEAIGSIREYIKLFADKYLPEVDGWQVLCKQCHKHKTHKKGEE